jgi:hypothetical protein
MDPSNGQARFKKEGRKAERQRAEGGRKEEHLLATKGKGEDNKQEVNKRVGGDETEGRRR